MQRAVGRCEAAEDARKLAVERPPEPPWEVGADGDSSRYPGEALEDADKWVLVTKKSGTAEVAFVS